MVLGGNGHPKVQWGRHSSSFWLKDPFVPQCPYYLVNGSGRGPPAQPSWGTRPVQSQRAAGSAGSTHGSGPAWGTLSKEQKPLVVTCHPLWTGMAGPPREFGGSLPFIFPQLSSAASFLQGDSEVGVRDPIKPTTTPLLAPTAQGAAPLSTWRAAKWSHCTLGGQCYVPQGEVGGRMGPTSSCGRGKPAAGGWSRGE